MNTDEPSLARRTLTALVLAVALFAAVIVQLTVVNRLPLPGSAAPDLVLLLVTAIAAATGPVAGALAGFAGGLALDIAPPVTHYAGEYALVFCLAGYAAARVVGAIRDVTGERDPVVTFTVMAAAAAAGEAGKAALGMLLSDPDVTIAAVSRVLPSAILYDLLLAPFAFWLVARVTRGVAPERAPAPEFSRQQRLASVFRQASAGAAPDLRLAGTGQNYHRPPVPGRVPSLRLSDARSSSSRRTKAAGTGGAALPAGVGRSPKLSFAGDGQARPARRPARTPGKNWLRPGMPPAVPATAPARRSPGKNWLRPATSPAVPATTRTARSPGKNWLRTGMSPAVRPATRPARTPGKNWLSGGAPGSATARSLPASPSAPGSSAGAVAGRASHGPGRGWLRSAPPAGAAATRTARTPDRGWLRSAGAGRSGGGLAGTAGPGGPRSAAAVLAARSAPSGLSVRTPGLRRSPRRGWLSGVSRPPGAGSGTRRGHGASRGLRASAFRGDGPVWPNWHAASPSGGWLRHSRHPWHRRRQRLLGLVGVDR